MVIENEAEMMAFAGQFAKICEPPLVIYLVGDLGAGKTTFARGFLRGLGFSGRVKSPTYTLVEVYALEQIELFHFDLYRIRDVEELELIGIRDYFHQRSVCLIEWPEQGKGSLPEPDIICNFNINNECRGLNFSSHSIKGGALLQKLMGTKEKVG